MAFLGFTSLDESNEFTRALLFGDAGSGKTSCAAFVANLPGDGITVFVDVEGGLKKDALRKLGVDTSKIAIWPDREKGEEVNYDTLEQLLFRLRATLRARPGSIKATVFDSTTEVSGGLLVDITTPSRGTRPSPPSSGPSVSRTTRSCATPSWRRRSRTTVC
jgi:GTPase SAR1 family protein